MSKKVKWLKRPEDKDWLAANDYLNLLGYDSLPDIDLNKLPIQSFKAKDILRASGLQLLPENNIKVKSKEKKINDGNPLSPIILVLTEPGKNLVIADGYHRVCAVFYENQDAEIPCIIRYIKPTEH